MKLVKSSEIVIVIGDFNAKVGRSRREDVVGDYVPRTLNERSDRLV